jgi:hypothetical protein
VWLRGGQPVRPHDAAGPVGAGRRRTQPRTSWTSTATRCCTSGRPRTTRSPWLGPGGPSTTSSTTTRCRRPRRSVPHTPRRTGTTRRQYPTSSAPRNGSFNRNLPNVAPADGQPANRSRSAASPEWLAQSSASSSPSRLGRRSPPDVTAAETPLKRSPFAIWSTPGRMSQVTLTGATDRVIKTTLRGAALCVLMVLALVIGLAGPASAAPPNIPSEATARSQLAPTSSSGRRAR